MTCDACKLVPVTEDCHCGKEHGRREYGEDNHHSSKCEDRPDGGVGDTKLWCEKCKTNHHHEDELRRGGSKRAPVGCGKGVARRPAHSRREFRLNLTRNMFPFLTSRRGVAVTGFHILLDTKDCKPASVKLSLELPPHRIDEGKCSDTEEIRLVRGEGGLLKGGVVLKQEVELDERSSDPRGKGKG